MEKKVKCITSGCIRNVVKYKVACFYCLTHPDSAHFDIGYKEQVVSLFDEMN